MRTALGTTAALLGWSALASAIAIPAELHAPTKRGHLPFNKLVVFGDQLSDDGSGSWAHGLDDSDAYFHHTWTDGDVMVQYLSRALGLPLVDYAWGGKNGQGLFGSTLDNAYTPASDSWRGRPVPSTLQQIANYSSGPERAGASHALHLLWVGQNDIKAHTNWYAQPSSKITLSNQLNAGFIQTYAKMLLEQAESLIKMGAPAVVVVNIYPIEKAPENWMFFCHKRPGCEERWGTVVRAANAHLKETLARSPYASKLIYYDVYGFMDYIMANKDRYGFTAGLNDMCDGRPGLPTTHFQACLRGGKGVWAGARPYFWFNNGQMATQVHQFIAQNLARQLDAHFHA